VNFGASRWHTPRRHPLKGNHSQEPNHREKPANSRSYQQSHTCVWVGVHSNLQEVTHLNIVLTQARFNFEVLMGSGVLLTHLNL
jgi:hypothetical protein